MNETQPQPMDPRATPSGSSPHEPAAAREPVVAPAPELAGPAPAEPAEPGERTEEPYPSFWSTEPILPPTRRRERSRRRWPAAFLAALLGAAGGTAGTYYLLEERTATGANGGVVRVAPPVERPASQDASAASLVAEAVLPSIVNIEVATRTGGGNGSGVIYRTDGYIVTNDHVVAGADSIRVTLSNGDVLDAALVGSAAPTIDIAVLKVAKDGMAAAVLGTIKDVRPGDLAVAIGSPFGLQGTVTAGVVSALHRNISLGAGVSFQDAIQTDAPINPGNSGGALANARGEVIGINTAIIGGSGGNVGVGFAIPIDIVRKVADQIIETGTARFPFLGISGVSLPDNRGAQIREIVPGGPADEAGMRVGDVVVRFAGEQVNSMEDLIQKIINRDVGDQVTVEYVRGSETRTVTVTLAERPGD